MSCIAKRILPWLTMAFAFSSCGDEGGQQQAAASMPPTQDQLVRRAAAGMGQVAGDWAMLRPAAGLNPADYEAFGPAADDPAPVAANGVFSTSVFAGRAGFVFAGPREGTATRASLPAESGLYMSPALGQGTKIAYGVTQTGQPAWVVSAQGYMALDATTTVLSLILLDAAFSSPDPAIQQALAAWLIGKISAGWPAAAAASIAYDAALGQRRDPAVDPAFVTPMGQARAEAIAQIPAPQPVALAHASRSEVERRFAGLELDGAFVSFAADPNAKVAIRVASAGKVRSFVTPKALDDKHADVSVGALRGTPVDLYYTIYRIDKASLSKDSSAIASPRLTDRFPRKGDLVKAGVISADSWFGYLDVFGNAVSGASNFALWASGALSAKLAGPPTEWMAEDGEALEIRVFSGGFARGMSPEIVGHVESFYAQEAEIAYRQNVAMTVVEFLLSIPGADAIIGEEFGAKVIQSAIAQAFVDLESHAATRGTTSDGVSASITEICGNAAKAAFDTAVQEASAVKAQLRGGWRKLFAFVASGGHRLLKTVGRTLTGGWVCKGGKVVDRIAAMAQPYSLMELHVVDVGGGACIELLESIAKQAGSDFGLRFRTICEDCLESSCQAECKAELEADSAGFAACRDACSAAVNPCVEKVHAETTACNQRCGQTRTAACNNDPDCLFRIPGECMKECKPFDALGGGPCFSNLNPCFTDCAKTYAAAKAAEDGFFNCVQRACKDRCEPAKKE